MTTTDDTASASGRVRDALRTQILRGELPPGARLMDRALAPQHGVSRNSVREALRLLESDGLVVHARNTGSSVRVLTAADVADIYAARRVLEVGGVQTSSRATDRDLAEVDRAATAGLHERTLEDWRGAGTASLVFHAALVGLAGSARLNAFFTDLAAQLRLAFAVMPDEAAFQTQWMERDRTIADLLLSGRRDAAEIELLAYLADSEAAVVDAVRAAQRSAVVPR
ncbi:hypothetical protein AUQ48_02380 [Kocuria flava]|uniref:HTH gntR-type domain-containing protein n=1 Tax=Kocuria flava TaxID=446860 RepID=A0A2N4SZA5_9MICC|nr:GntR family transcriptional regulator [Kocuria flava]PLC11303.1 hypothetical protein AUQ48_02380 [Kocuria flava]